MELKRLRVLTTEILKTLNASIPVFKEDIFVSVKRKAITSCT